MRKRFEELFKQQDAVDGLLAELAKERHELEEKYIKLCGTRRLTVSRTKKIWSSSHRVPAWRLALCVGLRAAARARSGSAVGDAALYVLAAERTELSQGCMCFAVCARSPSMPGR